MKTYFGTRTIDVIDVWVVENNYDKTLNINDSLKVRSHSPTGFEWGYNGSGPAQLALAILLDLTQDADLSESLYQKFKQDFVSHWSGDRWSINEEEIRNWIKDQQPQ